MSVLPAIFLVLMGAAFLLYPFISNYLNNRNAGAQIESYVQKTEETDGAGTEELFRQAEEYNKQLFEGHIQLTDPFDPDAVRVYTENYERQLAVDDSGIMAYVEIPSIDVYLPVCHGTGDDVLQTAVGHLEGSSLPVGGGSTHCVLSGHTGLRNARLFTDLTEVEEGDYFFVHVLDKELAYQVDQICVTEPDDVSELMIRRDMDYVTLVTCTPYGINSHRLLVRGVRTDYERARSKTDKAPAFQDWDSQWMKQYRQALLTGFGILLVIVFISKIIRRGGKK